MAADVWLRAPQCGRAKSNICLCGSWFFITSSTPSVSHVCDKIPTNEDDCLLVSAKSNQNRTWKLFRLQLQPIEDPKGFDFTLAFLYVPMDCFVSGAFHAVINESPQLLAMTSRSGSTISWKTPCIQWSSPSGPRMWIR